MNFTEAEQVWTIDIDKDKHTTLCLYGRRVFAVDGSIGNGVYVDNACRIKEDSGYGS